MQIPRTMLRHTLNSRTAAEVSQELLTQSAVVGGHLIPQPINILRTLLPALSSLYQRTKRGTPEHRAVLSLVSSLPNGVAVPLLPCSAATLAAARADLADHPTAVAGMVLQTNVVRTVDRYSVRGTPFSVLRHRVEEFFRSVRCSEIAQHTRNVDASAHVQWHLRVTIKEAYKMYVDDCAVRGEEAVRRSTFYSWKPPDVRERSFLTCVCGTCKDMDEQHNAFVQLVQRLEGDGAEGKEREESVTILEECDAVMTHCRMIPHQVLTAAHPSPIGACDTTVWETANEEFVRVSSLSQQQMVVECDARELCSDRTKHTKHSVDVEAEGHPRPTQLRSARACHLH
jgi:hypothetical protein